MGVDLAAEAKSTAAVRIDWDARELTRLDVPADDAAIVDFCAGADRVGIDCPFGWPERFAEFVVAHRAGDTPAVANDMAARRLLAYRTTDLHCQAEFGLRPLSVSADRIAHATFRCAGLLALLGVTDRSGTGRVAETYPAGALRLWQLDSRGYKHDLTLCQRILDELCERTALHATFLIESDHQLDAAICGLIAYALEIGATYPVPAEHRQVAAVEGWIVLPTPDSLAIMRERRGDPAH